MLAIKYPLGILFISLFLIEAYQIIIFGKPRNIENENYYLGVLQAPKSFASMENSYPTNSSSPLTQPSCPGANV